MNAERDKFIVEALGGCWHNFYGEYGCWACSKCHVVFLCNEKELESKQINLSPWSGFGWAWEKLPKKEFIVWFSSSRILPPIRSWILWEGFSLDEKVEVLYEFLKEKSK